MTEFIDARWLSEVLSQPVSELQQTALSAAGGYLADVHRLQFQTPRGTRTLILKTASTDPEKRSIAARYDSYRKEADFYRYLAPRAAVKLPRCHFVQPPPAFALLLEDLGAGTGEHPPGGLNEVQAWAGISALSNLHAMPVDPPPTAGELTFPGFEASFRAAAAELAELAEPLMSDTRAGDIVRRYCEDPAAILPYCLAAPQVISHMDVRPANFSLTSGSMTLFDWGEWCLAPAGMDLASFLVFSLAISDRRRLELPLLAEYQHGVPQMRSMDELLTEYRLGLLPAIYLPALMLSRNQEPRLARLLAEQLLAAIEDHAPALESLLSRP